MLCGDAQAFTEALIVHKLALTQKAYHIFHIRVINKPQDVIVGGAGFLFRRQILMQIGDGVSLRSNRRGIKRDSGG